MSASRNESIPSSDMPVGEGERLLAELEALLDEQIALAAKGQLEQVSSLTERVEQILIRAPACTSPPCDGETGKRILRLYNELCLILAAEKDQLNDTLKRIRAGKNSLGAYQNAFKK